MGKLDKARMGDEILSTSNQATYRHLEIICRPFVIRRRLLQRCSHAVEIFSGRNLHSHPNRHLLPRYCVWM